MAVAGSNVRYATAATARSDEGSGVIDQPHPGQNASPPGISAPQWGHFVESSAASSAGSAGAGGELLSELDNSASIGFPSAFFAHTIDLEGVASCDVVVLATNFPLDLSDLLRKKFDGCAAICAHHMVMTAAIVLMFITRDAVMKRDFTSQAATGQKLQRPIDRGETDTRIGFFYQPVQFVDGKMFASFKESSQNRVPLPGLFQANTTKMLKKNSFRFAHAFPRNCRLVVDSLLQHGVQREMSSVRGPEDRTYDTGEGKITPRERGRM
jgi:hypothetical protein